MTPTVSRRHFGRGLVRVVWVCKGHDKENADTDTEYEEIFLNLTRRFLVLKNAPTVFSGGVYDCWTDVERSVMFFYHHDHVLKVSAAVIKEANALLTTTNVPTYSNWYKST